MQGTKKWLSMERLAVVHSVFFGSIYNGSPFHTFPYRGGMCLATSSMSPSTLMCCFSCASASGCCCTNVWYSDCSVENLFVQNVWCPGTGTSPILDTIFTFHFPPSSSELFSEKRAQPRGSAAINAEHTQVQPTTSLQLQVVSLLQH
jgi:hypothetical protein